MCLLLNALALVLNVLAENLDALKCGGWGVFIAPTTKVAVGEAVCRRAHRTLFGGKPDSLVRQIRAAFGFLLLLSFELFLGLFIGLC